MLSDIDLRLIKEVLLTVNYRMAFGLFRVVHGFVCLLCYFVYIDASIVIWYLVANL